MSSEVNINNVNMVITTQDDINREIIMTTPLGIENTENAQIAMDINSIIKEILTTIRITKFPALKKLYV